jgi:hypothetical protein
MNTYQGMACKQAGTWFGPKDVCVGEREREVLNDGKLGVRLPDS